MKTTKIAAIGTAIAFVITAIVNVSACGNSIVTPNANEFIYNYDAVLEGVIITAYNGNAKRIRFPSEIDGDIVKQIGNTEKKSNEIIGSFSSDKSCVAKYVEYVEIPDTVTSLGDYTFYECEDLAKIVMPDTIESIGIGAFGGCIKLADINLPENLKNIDDGAFANCDSLTQITLPDKVREIKSGAFNGCDSLAVVKLPNGLNCVEAGLFGNCESLKEVEIPNTVREIKYFAFRNCKSLRALDIPSSVRGIDEGSFYECDALTVTYKGETYNYSNMDDLYAHCKNNPKYP